MARSLLVRGSLLLGLVLIAGAGAPELAGTHPPALAAGTGALAQVLSAQCSDNKSKPKPDDMLPIFYVLQTGDADTVGTPEIAYNDYAAITGNDYSTLFIAAGKPTAVKARMKAFLIPTDYARTSPPTQAYTVELKAVKSGTWMSYRDELTYKPYTKKQPSLLHWLKCTPGKNATKTQNRMDAGCTPSGIFKVPDLALDEPTKWEDRASCDEYPFASSKEGGSGSLIRGVPVHENFPDQAHNLARFLQENIEMLARHGGLFGVCVKLDNGKQAGTCESKRYDQLP